MHGAILLPVVVVVHIDGGELLIVAKAAEQVLLAIVRVAEIASQKVQFLDPVAIRAIPNLIKEKKLLFLFPKNTVNSQSPHHMPESPKPLQKRDWQKSPLSRIRISSL